jgi:hypothetical protein
MDILVLADDKIIENKRLRVLPKIKISGLDIQCAVMQAEMPDFNENFESNKDCVLVRVDYFSCNYRDKALIVKASLKIQNKQSFNTPPIAFFGSDFVGTVVKKAIMLKLYQKKIGLYLMQTIHIHHMKEWLQE